MKTKRDIKKEIIQALKEKPATVKELSEKMGLCRETINKRLREIRSEQRKNGTVYIAEWLEGDYAFSRVFAFGIGTDAPTPNRKIAGPKSKKTIQVLSPEPVCRRSNDKIVFRHEFLDEWAFRIVTGRTAQC